MELVGNIAAFLAGIIGSIAAFLAGIIGSIGLVYVSAVLIGRSVGKLRAQ